MSDTSDYQPTDPRDEPAPLGLMVLLTGGSALAIIVLVTFFSGSTSLRPLLLGPIMLVGYEVLVHEVWWKRWWGAVPGAIAGLVTYFEGRAMLADLIGDTWAHPLAFVTAWVLFAVVFCLASRYPRTDFTAQRARP
ncbi:hypothetical protein [Nonomuraea sp. SBT364]|uniref:hypothetical protein n=1 Tax=Nonomuraea sp. SBT364 TaxID=1580530 RepID=UPI0012E3082E|nr:hypothetical protein [Nonomuraea sp. SBT364]